MSEASVVAGDEENATTLPTAFKDEAYFAPKTKKTKMDVAPVRRDLPSPPIADELLWRPATPQQLDKHYENPFVAILPEIFFDVLLSSVFDMLD